MHDLKWIRENPGAFDMGLARRALAPAAEQILALDAERRQVQTELQEMQERRNTVSKEIGAAMGAGRGDDAEALKAEVSALKENMQDAEARERTHAAALDEFILGLPNILADDVPEGTDEADNLELRRVGEPAAFDFEAKQHFDLGEALGLMDFETAGKLSGARFVILKGALARLERALAQFMLDTHTANSGYREVSPPLLVRDDALWATGQLPKMAEDMFKTEQGHWLIPTAEVPLTAMSMGETVEETDLPKRYVAHTCCFRSEAGAAGKDTRGMIRQHQFYKVELVSICHPDKSDDELDRMTACAEDILQRLGLAYRVVVLSSGDTGFNARKTHDLEVWLPGQVAYREISSCSNVGPFQARRMNARFRPASSDGKKARPAFVHTLNGSGVAVGRALIAVMETYQNEDGTITVPEPLRPYMGSLEAIARDE